METWSYKGIEYRFNSAKYYLNDKLYSFSHSKIWDLIADFGFSEDEARIAYVNNVIDGR